MLRPLGLLFNENILIGILLNTIAMDDVLFLLPRCIASCKITFINKHEEITNEYAHHKRQLEGTFR